MSLVDLDLDLHPTDLEGQKEREEEQARRSRVAVEQRRQDLAWTLTGPKGRRELRRLFAEGGISVTRDNVETVHDRNHGVMCFNEATRIRAFQKIWLILRMVADGEIPFGDFQKLMQETDEL